MLDRLPKFTRNFYFIAFVMFFFWMLFIDSNNLITQWQRTQKLNELKDEKDYYKEKIKEVEKDREELLSDDELLEKFAREKYYMKKPAEDLYVIVEKDK